VQSCEGADERVLGEVLRQILIAGQPEDQPIHAWGMGVVQLPPGDPVPREDGGDQSTFVLLRDGFGAKSDLHRVDDIP
jgi:hypothetical protein